MLRSDFIGGDQLSSDDVASGAAALGRGAAAVQVNVGDATPAPPESRLSTIERQLLQLAARVNVLTWTTAAIGGASLLLGLVLFALMLLVLNRLITM